MVYAYPANITGLAGLATWANSSTEGFFWSLILAGLFAILFFSFKSYSTERAFAASSFISMIIAILLGIMGLVSSYVVIFTMIIAGVAVLVLRNTNNREY